MPRDARKYLFDIPEAASLISQFVAGKTLQDYLGNALLQSGVERQFEIVGEALGQLAKLVGHRWNETPDFAARGRTDHCGQIRSAHDLTVAAGTHRGDG
jgi:uncharacterized protein with HEPN domain